MSILVIGFTLCQDSQCCLKNNVNLDRKRDSWNSRWLVKYWCPYFLPRTNSWRSFTCLPFAPYLESACRTASATLRSWTVVTPLVLIPCCWRHSWDGWAMSSAWSNIASPDVCYVVSWLLAKDTRVFQRLCEGQSALQDQGSSSYHLLLSCQSAAPQPHPSASTVPDPPMSYLHARSSSDWRATTL